MSSPGGLCLISRRLIQRYCGHQHYETNDASDIAHVAKEILRGIGNEVLRKIEQIVNGEKEKCARHEETKRCRLVRIGREVGDEDEQARE